MHRLPLNQLLPLGNQVCQGLNKRLDRWGQRGGWGCSNQATNCTLSETNPSEGAGDKMTSSPCHCCYILKHLAGGKTKPSIKLKSTLPPSGVWAAQVPAHIAALPPAVWAPDKTLGSAPLRPLLGGVIWNIFLNNRDVRKIVKLRSARGSPLLGWAPAVRSGLWRHRRGAGWAEALASSKGAEARSQSPGKAAFLHAFAPDHALLLQLPPNVFIKLQGGLLRLALVCSLI